MADEPLDVERFMARRTDWTPPLAARWLNHLVEVMAVPFFPLLLFLAFWFGEDAVPTLIHDVLVFLLLASAVGAIALSALLVGLKWDGMRPRSQEPLELEATLTELRVSGRTLQLATLEWRRAEDGELVLLEGGGGVTTLTHLADLSAVEAFLTRHVERARMRHGEGRREVPKALRRTPEG